MTNRPTSKRRGGVAPAPETAGQIEFALPVAVCAWCRPQERGDGLGVISHGICPRHLRKLEREIKGLVLHRSPRLRLRRASAQDGWLAI
jgi:hypothetical protein